MYKHLWREFTSKNWYPKDAPAYQTGSDIKCVINKRML